jgi:hypothetical protein
MPRPRFSVISPLGDACVAPTIDIIDRRSDDHLRIVIITSFKYDFNPEHPFHPFNLFLPDYLSSYLLLHHCSKLTVNRIRNEAPSMTEAMAVAPV